MERAIFRKINAFPKAKEEVILWVFRAEKTCNNVVC